MNSESFNYQEIYNHIVGKACKDDDFRERLIASPRETIEQELAIAYPLAGPIPDDIKIKVVEESNDTIYVVLPRKMPGEKSDELSDADLELVAGGKDGVTCGGGTGGSCIFASQKDAC